MIVQKFIAELRRQCEYSGVVKISEAKAIKPERGYNLLIEFENGFVMRVDGYVSIEKEKTI